MIRTSDIPSGYALKAITDQLTADLKAAIKEPVMKQLEAEVDRAVDQIVAQYNIAAEAHRRYDQLGQEVVFKVWRKP